MVIRNIGIVLFINYICQKDICKALRTMFMVYFLLLLANFLCVIVYPMGMYNYDQYDAWGRGYWLFGHANATITFAFPAICISILYAYFFGKKSSRVLAVILIVVSVAQIFIIQSVTSMIGLVVFFAVWICIKNNLLNRLLKVKRVILVGVLACIGIVGFRIQEYFSDFIVNVLNRSVTFTGRTNIWAKSLEIIRNNPIFGIGYHTGDYWSATILAPSSHNEYIYALVQGGVVLFALFLSIYFFAGKMLNRYRKNPCSQIFVAVICSLLTQFLVETHMHRLAALLGIMGCVSIFCNSYNAIIEKRFD